jgi:hypothetical protein
MVVKQKRSPKKRSAKKRSAKKRSAMKRSDDHRLADYENFSNTCQAFTDSGKKCSRYATYKLDLRVNKKVNKIKSKILSLIGLEDFDTPLTSHCCFYCTQHAKLITYNAFFTGLGFCIEKDYSYEDYDNQAFKDFVDKYGLDDTLRADFRGVSKRIKSQ